MASIRGKNTKPEVTIRKLLWADGKRYRLHDKTIFGQPDISNKRKKIAVFIDGCFWHGCQKCYKEPTTNVGYWRDKILRNSERRKTVLEKLSSEDWKVVQIWEHEINQNPHRIASMLAVFF